MHILLLVSGFQHISDPRRGMKFVIHLESYLKRGWKVGVISTRQHGISLGKVLFEGKTFKVLNYKDAYIVMNVLSGKTLHLPEFALERVEQLGVNISFSHYLRYCGCPEIIHGHGSLAVGKHCLEASRRIGIPYVLTEHNSSYLTGSITSGLKEKIRPAIENANCILPVSYSLGNAMQKLYGQSMPPWHVVPNIVDNSFFEISRVSEHTDKFIVFSVGYMTHKKRPDILVKAFAEAFGDSDGILKLAGEGPEINNICKLVFSLGIEDKVDLLGPISHQRVAYEMAHSSVYVVSSDVETFSIPVVEAHAVGLPVVATCCGGPEELVNSDNGILVPRGDYKAMADALNFIRDRYSDYNPDEIRKRALLRFGEKAILDKLSSVYNSVCI